MKDIKRKKGKLITIAIVIVLLASVLGGVYLFFNYKNKYALTLNENKWIDSNKRNMIDVALLNDVSIFSYEGEGIVYDYLEYVTDKYSLNFNFIPYKLGDTVEYEYKLVVKNSTNDNDIVLNKDNLVLLTLDNRQFSKISNITNLKIGICSSDTEIIGNYFEGQNVEFVEYGSYTELKEAYSSSKTNLDNGIQENPINGIILPKLLITKELIQNNYNISFQFNDLNKYLTLETNGSVELNSILNKAYSLWKEDNYEKQYNVNLLNNYYSFKNLSDVDQKELKSKNYKYGFIDYGVYNYLDNNKISGLSGLLLKKFKDFSDLSITYTRYNSVSSLLKDFNTNKIDFMLNITDSTNYSNQIYSTVGVLKKDLVIVSGISDKTPIDGIHSLTGKEVLTIKDTYLEKYLTDRGIKVKLYSNMKDLLKDFSAKDIVITDLENYNYYKTSSFKDTRISYLLNGFDNYNYVINDIDDNKSFENLFNFYISYNSAEKLISSNYSDIAYNNKNIIYLLFVVLIIFGIYVVIDFSNHIKYMLKNVKKNKKVRLTKEEKIKYIDQLTSLKNRAYLNSRIESWDDSEVYPQSIIIIDLNNISYINDNYGREEGDKVITEAANILIQHQMQNSEIIRTDGNEFLIYLVGYSEKQIISYLRKLNKEFKNLSHGFGAASGYSIITDAIKTVDDAVNEATIAMKENKEDIDY